MCGIFAYIGARQALQLLLVALQRLEYRGYDSAGVGIQNRPIKVRKKVGKVENLKNACASNAGELEGTIGIAHTRWATHGKPSDENSHPHATREYSIAVVHNGVIENYQALKQQLKGKGYVFKSETDTELLAHLVQDVRKQMPTATWGQVVAMALQFVTGAYGVVFMFEDEPDLLVGARKGSPLILGIGDGEYMLASDASAVIEHTKDVIYIRDGEMVECTRTSYKINTISKMAASGVEEGSPRPADGMDNPIVRLELCLEQIEKGGYPHFMLKEIMDQPNALRNAMRGRLCQDPWSIKLGGFEKILPEGAPAGEGKSALERIANANRVIVCACGTSWHSALILKYVFESLARLPVEVEYASEFRYRRPLISEEDIIFAISQSGETADTLEAIKIAKEHKAMTIGIVNVVGSSIARETDVGAFLHAGPEIGVASTKAFTGQVVIILLLALQIALKRGTISKEAFEEYCAALDAIPEAIGRWLPSLVDNCKVLSRYFRLAENVLFCGCGVHFPVSLEGALKLKEISYIHAEGFTTAEIKHGPLTLVKSFMPVFCIAMKSDPAYEQTKHNIRELKAKDAALIILTNEGNDDFSDVASFVLYCPDTKLELEPLLSVIPMQLFSYFIADMRGCSIDQPRNLAKSVTVE